MIDFNKNELINSVLEQYYNTFSRTLDTCDFVPEKYNDKINKYIFKNMRKKFKEIDKEDRKYFKSKKQKQKEIEKQKQKEIKEEKRTKIENILSQRQKLKRSNKTKC